MLGGRRFVGFTRLVSEGALGWYAWLGEASVGLARLMGENPPDGNPPFVHVILNEVKDLEYVPALCFRDPSFLWSSG